MRSRTRYFPPGHVKIGVIAAAIPKHPLCITPTGCWTHAATGSGGWEPVGRSAAPAAEFKRRGDPGRKDQECPKG